MEDIVLNLIKGISLTYFIFGILLPILIFIIILSIIDWFFKINKGQRMKYKVNEKLDFLLDEIIEKRETEKKDIIDLLNNKRAITKE